MSVDDVPQLMADHEKIREKIIEDVEGHGT